MEMFGKNIYQLILGWNVRYMKFIAQHPFSNEVNPILCAWPERVKDWILS